MQFFRGLQSYFTEFDGVYRLPDERIRIWNIPADSSTLTEKGLKVSKRSTRCIRSTCARLDEENSDRYIIFNFSPVMMELVESCHRGQVLDFSKQALQNFALLMEVCLTVSKWIQAGGETSGSEHVAILTFFEETDAVWYPNYAAMLAACYLIFSGYSSGGGSETLEYVEQELGILRSKLHAPSQESYANYFQLLIEIPILPNPNRLRLVRVSLQNMQSLQGKKLGLQIENEGRTFLFSDPTEWYVGDSASFEVCINTNTSLFGDFSISVYDYEVTSGGSAASASKSESEVKTLSSSMSTVSQKKLVTKRRLFRLAFSTIFIHQEVYRVRVREMDYVAPNTLSDDFFAHLHFSKCQPGPMDGEYVEQLSQRVEQSPQRQQFRVLHPRGRGVPGFRGGAGSVASRRSQSRYRNGFDGEFDGNGSSAMYYRHDGTMCYGSSSAQSVIRWAHLVPPSGGPSLYMPVSMHLIQEDPRQMDQEDDEVEGEPEVIARQPVSVERPKTPQQLRGGGLLMQGQAMGTPVRESSKAHELADRSPMPMRPTPPTVRLATPPPPTGGKLPPPPPLVPGGPPPCPAPPPPPTLSKGAPPAPPPPLSSSMKGAPPAPPPPPPGKFGTSKAVNGSVPPPPVPAARVGPKLKSMFWKSISKPVGIWAVHDDDTRRVALDEAFLATMFAAKKNVVAASRETTSKSKSNRLVQHSHVFKGQRLQNIAIALRQLRIPVEDVCRALLYCDTSLLNAEQRETLISVLPLPEDITALAHEKATGCVEWTDVETYLYSLATTIVDVVERVQLWDAAESLEETVAQVTEQLQAEEAAVAVMTSKQTRFARLMRTVLAVGNFMNQGTMHANASGFRLESLQQLNFVKAVDGKVTMLEVIVTLLLEEAPELVQLGEEIAAVRAVASSPLQDLGQQVTQANYLLQSMRRVVEESKDTSEWFAQRLPHYTPETTTDALPQLMEKAVSRYLPVVMQMVLRHQQLRNEVAAMLESYGEDPSSDETLLWQHVIVFEKDLQQCVTKVQQCKLTKYSLLISVDPDATQLGEADTKECEQSSHVDPAALELPKVPAGGVCGIRHPKLRLSDADDDSD